MCKEYQAKICEIESHKYDTEKEVEYKDYMVRKKITFTFTDVFKFYGYFHILITSL